MAGPGMEAGRPVGRLAQCDPGERWQWVPGPGRRWWKESDFEIFADHLDMEREREGVREFVAYANGRMDFH